MQSAMATGRTTRLTAIGRFRRERIEMKLRTQQERMEYLAYVVGVVTDLVLEAQRDLRELRAQRKEHAAALHRELDAFQLQLSEDVRAQLGDFIQDRRTMAKAFVDDMAKFRAQLAKDVEDIVSDDFL